MLSLQSLVTVNLHQNHPIHTWMDNAEKLFSIGVSDNSMNKRTTFSEIETSVINVNNFFYVLSLVSEKDFSKPIFNDFLPVLVSNFFIVSIDVFSHFYVLFKKSFFIFLQHLLRKNVFFSSFFGRLFLLLSVCQPKGDSIALPIPGNYIKLTNIFGKNDST